MWKKSNQLYFLCLIVFYCNVSAAEEPVAHLKGYSIHKGLQSRQVVFLWKHSWKRLKKETMKQKTISQFFIETQTILIFCAQQGDPWSRGGARLSPCHRSIWEIYGERIKYSYYSVWPTEYFKHVCIAWCLSQDKASVLQKAKMLKGTNVLVSYFSTIYRSFTTKTYKLNRLVRTFQSESENEGRTWYSLPKRCT